MKRDLTKKTRQLLERGYRNGAIDISNLCPHCAKDMGAFNHGMCQHCKKSCGCSFNPCSDSDYCDTHR